VGRLTIPVPNNGACVEIRLRVLFVLIPPVPVGRPSATNSVFCRTGNNVRMVVRAWSRSEELL
jgi:hypothetical protein